MVSENGGGWIATSERLPDLGVPVLAHWLPQTEFHKACTDTVVRNETEWNGQDDYRSCAVPDYWMPLPPPPNRRE